MVIHHPKDGPPLSKIYQKESCYQLEVWHIDLTQKNKTRWTTRDAYSLSQGGSPTVLNLPKEVYNRLEIWHLDLTHKIKTRWSWDGQPPPPGWSPNIPRMVTHYPKSTRRICRENDCLESHNSINGSQGYWCGNNLCLLLCLMTF